MSRIGKIPIDLPAGVKVVQQGGELHFDGPQGKLSRRIHPEITVELDEKERKLHVKRPTDSRRHKMLHGTMRSLLAGCVQGVTKKFRRVLEVSGVGYNARIEGRTRLVIQLGLTHPVELKIPEGLQVECPSPVQIVVQGADKQLVGQFAANIRAKKPPDPYKVKGIKYADEVIRRKAGKTFVSGT